MEKKIGIILLVIILCSASYSIKRVAAQNKQGLKIAVVDLNRIEESSKKHKKAMDILKKDMKALKEALEGMNRELEEYNKALDNEKDPAIKREIEKKILKLKIEGMVKKKEGLKEYDDRSKVIIKALFKEICAATEGYAKEKGYGIVMTEMGAEIEGDTMDKLIDNINLKTIIYADKKYDITDEIIRYMNKKH